MWGATGKANYKCRSAFGTGACLKSGKAASYAQTTVAYSRPGNYHTPSKMSGDLSSGIATNAAIPTP